MKKIFLLSMLIICVSSHAQNGSGINYVPPSWRLTGNALSTNTNFIGSTSNNDFWLHTNSLRRFQFGANGTNTIYADSSTFSIPFIVQGGGSVNGANPYIQLTGFYIGAYRILNSTTGREWYMQNNTLAGSELDNFSIGRTSNPTQGFLKVSHRGKFSLWNYRSNVLTQAMSVDTNAVTTFSMQNNTRIIFGNYSSTIPFIKLRSSGHYTSTLNYNIGHSGSSFLLNDSIRVNTSINDVTQTRVLTNEVQIISRLKVGALSSPASTHTLDIAGNILSTGNSTFGGAILSTGGLTVTTKGINTTAGDAATINSQIGRFRKDNTGSSFTLTNSQITANSIIVLTLVTAGITTGNQLSVQAVAGSATITFETSGVAAAPNINCDVNFHIVN